MNAVDTKQDLIQDARLFIPEGYLETKTFALNGAWEFYPNQLLNSPKTEANLTRQFMDVPHWWAEEEGKPSVQFGTYRMQVVLPSSEQNLSLGLKMPDVYCSYTLIVNGRVLGQNGTVGTSKLEASPQWKPDTYYFESAKDTLDIVLQLSNFYHHRTGINSSLLLGRADQLKQKESTTKSTTNLLLAGLACLSVLGIIFYFVKGNIAFLLYVLLCVSWMIRAAFSNHYQIVQWIQDINWYLVVRTEYISLYLSTLFGSLLVDSLFPREVNKVFRIIFIITSVGFTVFTLLVPPVLFTAYVQLYLGLSSLLLLSILVIVTRAYSVSREGSTLVLTAAFVAVGMFSYVIMAYQGVFELNELIFDTGFLLQFTLTLVAIYKRIGKTDSGHDFDLMTFEGATKK